MNTDFLSAERFAHERAADVRRAVSQVRRERALPRWLLRLFGGGMARPDAERTIDRRLLVLRQVRAGLLAPEQARRQLQRLEG